MNIESLNVVCVNPRTGEVTRVGVLSRTPTSYVFMYTSSFTGPTIVGFPKLHEVYESERLFPMFSQRVMRPKRPDYPEYMERLGLPIDSSEWDQLRASGGCRQGDCYRLVAV